MKIPSRTLETRILDGLESRKGLAPSASASSTPLVTPPASSSQATIFAGITVGLILVTVMIFLLFRMRGLHAQNVESKPVPGTFLKRKWTAWKPWSTYSLMGISSDTPLTVGHAPNTPSPSAPASTVDEVNRRQSVRSVITLPSYHFKPHADERLIAREGERAGIDMVIELPESEELNEERREAEMSALYNIRQARRREATECETRRLERQQARSRGDWGRLRVMEEESRARARLRAQSEAVLLRATTSGTSANASSGARAEDLDLTGLTPDDSSYLIVELAAQREGNSCARAVSSVSYADLGLAWHDGSRIRTNSVDSDRPLLASAASMADSRAASRTSSISAQGGAPGPDDGTLTSHRRFNSNASILSTDSTVEHTPQTSSSPPDTRNGSRTEFHTALTPSSSHDLTLDPPSYDDDVSIHGGDAPPYESPVRERGPGFPEFRSSSESAVAVAAATTPTMSKTIPPALVPGPATAPSRNIFQIMTSPTSGERPKATTTPTPLGGSSTFPIHANVPRGRPQGPARLVLSSMPHLPAIEILSATPINSTPPTPTFDRWRNL